MNDPDTFPRKRLSTAALALLLACTSLLACRPAPNPEPQDEPEEAPELPRPQTPE